jgi:hypothetical protein
MTGTSTSAATTGFQRRPLLKTKDSMRIGANYMEILNAVSNLTGYAELQV